tara:strand:- start:29 stop:439 length:411 start_codon:yes stop_codon:yes gene_type:complete
MKYYYLSLITIFSCTSAPPTIPTKVETVEKKYFNKPFVSPAETTKLDFNQSQDEILKIMGTPLFVDFGGNNQIVWVYAVRTIKVKSVEKSNGEVSPRKVGINLTSTYTRYDKEDHHLALTFSDGKLTKWGPYDKKL